VTIRMMASAYCVTTPCCVKLMGLIGRLSIHHFGRISLVPFCSD
jgi:hypothetical protein